ncbi:MAG: FkbM family methyltransferase [Verrucomicrobiota bacterium]
MISRTQRILRQVSDYAGLADRWRDKLPLSFLGLIRGHLPVSGSRLDGFLRTVAGDFKVRPSILGGESAFLDISDPSMVTIFDELVLNATWDLSAVEGPFDLVLDLGAHTGLFSIMSAARYRRAAVVAFEPNPDNYHRLVRNVASFGSRVTPLEAAADIENGEKCFSVSNSFSGRLADSEIHEGLSGTASLVRTVSVKELVEDRAPSRLLLKMDIEGAEYPVLPDLIPVLPSATTLFLETHDGPDKVGGVNKRLIEAGFVLKHLRTHGQQNEFLAVRSTRPDHSIELAG